MDGPYRRKLEYRWLQRRWPHWVLVVGYLDHARSERLQEGRRVEGVQGLPWAHA